MTDLRKDLGVQSYCFRHFKDNATVARMVREIGLANIELCGVHADFNDASTYDSVIETYAKAGVKIVAIGVQYFQGDEAKERPCFEFAKRAGAKEMSVSFGINAIPDAFRVAEKLANEYDIRLGIHNHGGWHWLGNAETLAWVFGQTGKQIGLCLDTAWALDSGLSPVKLIEQFGDRLYGLHLKDFIFDRARKQEDVVVGTGNLDLPAIYAALDKVGFNGYGVLEYEGDVEDPVPALTDCVAMARNV